MPSTAWSKLSRQQLGCYAEYYAKMEFASFGFDIYTTEVDDHGVDFVAKSSRNGIFYEIQVKAVRGFQYTFIQKEKMRSGTEELPHNRLICFLRFEDGSLPETYVIPAKAWEKPNQILKDKDYIGKKSKPEWGINISKKPFTC